MIRYAGTGDFELLLKYEHCISEQELKNSIGAGRVAMAFERDAFAGWLRFGLFWDNTPFMNMLYVLEEYRGMGIGKRLTDFWEEEMGRAGYERVLTSTLSNEQAQFFYRKNGYTDCGSLLLPGDPLEIMMLKNLK